MQAGAQILMELKNRRGTILCAASHFLFMALKLPLPSFPLFPTWPFPPPFLPFLPSKSLSSLELFSSLLIVTMWSKGGQGLGNENV